MRAHPALSALPAELKTRLQIAAEAALVAGRIQRERLGGADIDIRTKSSGIDLVTAVDHACDAAIRDAITGLCERHGLARGAFLTEETYDEGYIDLGDTWVVDPVDGTTNYAHGFPHFAAVIAWVKAGLPQIGVVYDPLRQELFMAVRGYGAWLQRGDDDPAPLGVSAVPGLDQALLATGFPYDTQVKPEQNLALFTTFMTHCHGVRRAGSAALDLAYVAAGRLDGFWEPRLSPWDVAAGVLLVEEAGGRTGDFFGRPLALDRRRINIVASNGTALHEAIVAYCQAAPVAAQAG